MVMQRKMMNKIQIFQVLHDTITGTPGDKAGSIEIYEGKDAKTGLAAALHYLEIAHEGSDNAKSDTAYWAWEGDVAVARVLVAIFVHMVRGKTEFPSIPSIEGEMLVTKQSKLAAWARDLILEPNHLHEFAVCSHNYNTELGSNPHCKRKITGNLVHGVCNICGMAQEDFDEMELIAKEIGR